MSARLQVLGRWPDQTIWLWYDYANSGDYDMFSVHYYGDDYGMVRVSRKRGRYESTLHGKLLASGDLVFDTLWSRHITYEASDSPKDAAAIRRAVERFSLALDYLFAIYQQKLEPTSLDDEKLAPYYEPKDVPRKNPQRKRARRR